MAECQAYSCDRPATRIMSVRFASMRGVFVAPYCAEHPHSGAEEACGPVVDAFVLVNPAGEEER